MGPMSRCIVAALAAVMALGCDDDTAPSNSGPDTSTPSGPTTSGSFPPVSDLTASGPFTAATIRNTGPNNAYTVFHPSELAPGGVRNPIVSWGNGGATTPVDYPLLPHLASHGFVVVASNNPLVGGPQVRAGIDWILAQNDAAASPFYQKLDVNQVGGVGYSNGGLATLAAADHPALDTVVIISGGNVNQSLRNTNMPKLRTPIAYLCTADAASRGNCEADFRVAQVPAFFGVMNGSGHVDVTTFLGLGRPVILERLNASTLAWLRWQLMGDQSLRSTFLGSSCGLCTDPNWTVSPPKGWN